MDKEKLDFGAAIMARVNLASKDLREVTKEEWEKSARRASKRIKEVNSPGSEDLSDMEPCISKILDISLKNLVPGK